METVNEKKVNKNLINISKHTFITALIMLALEKCLRLLSPLSLTPSQQRRGTLSETDRSSGQVLSSSTLGIQDAGLLLPCWCWG